MRSLFVNPRVCRVLMALLFMLIATFIYGTAFHAMHARQERASIGHALWLGLAYALYRLPPTAVGIAIAAVLAIFLESRGVPAGKTPIDAGEIRWHRSRMAGMITVAMWLLLMTAAVACAGAWHASGWVLVVVWIILAPIFLIFWRARLTREGYYALETGDASRVNDERMQQVGGKGAQTAITIFLFFMALVAIPGEAVISGHWPVGALVETGVLFVVWTAALTYWNRRL